MSTCPRCATENELLDDGTTYCSECGQWLSTRDKALKERIDEFWEKKMRYRTIKKQKPCWNIGRWLKRYRAKRTCR